jgi:hypothetical protein
MCAYFFMATGSQLKFALAPLAGISPTTCDRYLAELAGARLLRRPGTGYVGFPLAAIEIANLLLALAAPRPAGAVEAAKALGGLFPAPPRAGDSSLLTALAGSLEIMARRIAQGVADDDAGGGEDFELTRCLAPLRGIMSWPSRGPETSRRYLPYIDSTTVAPAVVSAPFRRDFVITQTALIAVAKLMADADQDDDAASLPGETASFARTEASGSPTLPILLRACAHAQQHGEENNARRRPGSPVRPDRLAGQ